MVDEVLQDQEELGQLGPVNVQSQGSITEDLESHLNSLPDEAKDFILTNLTDETVAILGMVLGEEALQFFGTAQKVRDNELPLEGGELPEGDQSGGFASPSANFQQPTGSPFA